MPKQNTYMVPIERKTLEVWKVEASNPATAAMLVGQRIANGEKPDQFRELSMQMRQPQVAIADPFDPPASAVADVDGQGADDHQDGEHHENGDEHDTEGGVAAGTVDLAGALAASMETDHAPAVPTGRRGQTQR